MALCGCKANYPTIPTQSDAVTKVILQYRFPTSSIAVGSTASFDVLYLSPDGAYHSVTDRSQFFSADLTIARPTSGFASVTGVGPGATEVVASYLGFTASLPVRVRPATRTYPFIEMSTFGSVAGSTASIRAILWQTASQSRLVTSEATWTSSDPSVASVNAGSAELLHVGTAVITASAGGVSESLYLSVGPRY